MTIFIQAENLNPIKNKPFIDMIVVDSVSIFEKVIAASVGENTVRFTKDTHTNITVVTPLSTSKFEFDNKGNVLDSE